MRITQLRIFHFLLLLASLPLRAQEPPPDLAAIVGTYRGEALNGGSLDPVTTVFRFNGGRLTGEYTIDDEAGTFHGTISNAFFEDGKLRIEWTDRDGEGYAELDFSPDFRSFDGFWASYDSPNGAPWTGVKE
jgi:hypothetical protein